MKKYILMYLGIIVMIVVLTILFVCLYIKPTSIVEAKESASYELKELDSMYDDDFFYWVNPETGVNYIVFYGMDGRCTMTPRLSPTGNIMVTHN